MWHRDRSVVTPYYMIVEDYFNRKLMARLGYQFDGNSLTDFQVEAYTVIAQQAAKLERADLERDSKKRGKHG